MNRSFAALAVAMGLVASASITASAGVVLTRTESIVSGQVGPQQQQPHESTVMIEGNKEKMTMSGGRQIIVNLDKATMDIVDPTQKSYIEMPFPPKGMMGQAIGGPGLHVSDFSKTGKTRTVAGFQCDDYDGAGKLPMGSFTTVYCVSNKVPGASEFSAFQKTMMTKLKDTRPEMPASFPDGVPLAEDTTTQMNAINLGNLGNLPPEMAEKLKAQLANRPPLVTKAEVLKVEEKKIAAAEFEVPAGYTKRDAPTPHPGGMGGAPARPMTGGGAEAPGASAPITVAPPASN
jgi:hypothetical protein